MKNLFSVYSSEKSLTIFPWILSGGSTAWIHAARNWYCSHLSHWVQKRKAAFIEPQHVRWSIWSLMSSTTLMWHSIKDWEADNQSNKPTCLASRLNVMWQQDFAVLRKEFAIWNDVKMSQMPSITFSQQGSAKGRVSWAMSEGELYSLLSSSSWEVLFLQRKREYSFKSWVTKWESSWPLICFFSSRLHQHVSVCVNDYCSWWADDPCVICLCCQCVNGWKC